MPTPTVSLLQAPYPALAVANWFIVKAKDEGRKLTPLKLQKLVYIVHGHYLAITGEPLIRETFEAWKFGPVLPPMYRIFKGMESDGVKEVRADFVDVHAGELPVYVIPTVGDHSDERFLKVFWEAYRDRSAAQLVDETHLRNGAWDRVWSPNPNALGVEIPNDLIRVEFAAKY